MATTDIRFKRINDEYQCVRNAQTDLFGKVDTVEAAILGLTEAVAENRTLITENSEQIAENRKLITENRKLITENRELITENRKLITENRELILENSRKLDALIVHLDVPYKPPAGFLKE